MVGIIQKDLEDFGIRMAEDQRIEFSCSGTYAPRDAHSQMSALIGVANLFTLLRPAPARARISFDPCFVKKPQVNFRIVKKDLEQLHKGFSLFLVLAVGPRSRHFQAKTFVVKPTHYGPIPDLLVKLFGQMAVKLLSGPMGLIEPVLEAESVPHIRSFVRELILLKRPV